MRKNFLGLDGLKHFWSKAKTWIAEQIAAEVTAKIAEIVANAPEDLDTLKEIADWISSHANDAAAMNTAISTNASDISALKTSVAGKADTGHTHTKSEITDFPTSLPANGGTADSATNDGNGKNIANTYMSKSGGTFSGRVTFDRGYNNRTTTIDDFGITHSVEIHTKTIYPNNDLYPCIQLPNNKDINIDADNITLSTQNGGHTEIGGGNCIIDGDMHVNNIFPVNNIDAAINFSKNKNDGYDIILSSPNGIVNIPSTITPRKGTIDGATVSIGRSDGKITIGDINNKNSGYTTINNDCKMLKSLDVSGDALSSFKGSCDFGDISVHGKSLFPGGYIPRTYYINKQLADMTTADKTLFKKFFAFLQKNRCAQVSGHLYYKVTITTSSEVSALGIGFVGYQDYEGNSIVIDDNNNITVNSDYSCNYCMVGGTYEGSLVCWDLYLLADVILRNEWSKINKLSIGLTFTLLEKV